MKPGVLVDAACRSCDATGLTGVIGLGELPLPDALLTADQLHDPEPRFPLDVALCETCGLVQLVGDVPAERMFVDNYLYFSSFSDQVLRHASTHVHDLIARRSLGPGSLVVELASNDGYLLRNLVAAGIPAIGVDPAPEPAAAARAAGVPTIQRFFGRELARELVAEGRRADVMIANNVLAHVPDLDDVVGGIALLLSDDGLLTVENPDVRTLVEHVEFDTIYHEHVCYYSCTSIDRLMARHGLHLNHVERFPDLHGGTLRWHVSRRAGRSADLRRHLAEESALGIDRIDHYLRFGERVRAVIDDLRTLLDGLVDRGASIAAYGAAAKGTMLLNHVGLGPDVIDVVVDRNVHKHGRYMPGVHVPIAPVEELLLRQPDYTLLLAWNFADEIVSQQQEYLRRGGRFILPIPEPRILTAEAVA
jgi:SAM-dependent methyltransferase